MLWEACHTPPGGDTCGQKAPFSGGREGSTEVSQAQAGGKAAQRRTQLGQERGNESKRPFGALLGGASSGGQG